MPKKIFLLLFFIAHFCSMSNGAKASNVGQPKSGLVNEISAKTAPKMTVADKSRFKLANQVCAVVESEQPILMSDVFKVARERNIDHRSAQDELMRERALWVYAKQQLKYNVPDIYNNAKEHIKKIMETNKLTREEFNQILLKPPYSMTYRQYENEMAYFVLRNQIESSLAGSIQISDKEAKEEYERERLDRLKDFSVLFISVMPPKHETTSEKTLNNQFIKANKIRKQILDKNNLNTIKNKYKGQTDVSFVGPLDYQEGALKHKYDVQLKKNSADYVTKPFEDDGAVTMIWKIEKAVSEVNEKTGLENVQKDLYKRAVQRRLDAVTKNTLSSSSVEINCEW